VCPFDTTVQVIGNLSSNHLVTTQSFFYIHPEFNHTEKAVIPSTNESDGFFFEVLSAAKKSGLFDLRCRWCFKFGQSGAQSVPVRMNRLSLFFTSFELKLQTRNLLMMMTVSDLFNGCRTCRFTEGLLPSPCQSSIPMSWTMFLTAQHVSNQVTIH